MTSLHSENFWNERYRAGETPWDYGGVPPEFASYLQNEPDLGRILIPGCGSGYEIRSAIEAGNEAMGIDLSREAVKQARTFLGKEGGKVVQGDFFSYPFTEGDKFDAVYERTFLCAIPPELRPDYVRRIDSLLKPGGILLGFFLYGEEPDPPPYPLQDGDERTLFGAAFDLVESRPSRRPLPFFEGMERWQIWRKKT